MSALIDFGLCMSQDLDHYLTEIYSLGLVFLLQHLYFEAQPAHAAQHALRYATTCSSLMLFVPTVDLALVLGTCPR